jgi:hypothetical protein
LKHFKSGHCLIKIRPDAIRGPNVGTGTSSGHGAALRIARWWHCQHDTSSDRTPFRAHVAEGHRPDRIADAGHFHF